MDVRNRLTTEPLYIYIHIHECVCFSDKNTNSLNPYLLTTTIVAPPSNASKWQMGFNSAFKGLRELFLKCQIKA